MESPDNAVRADPSIGDDSDNAFGFGLFEPEDTSPEPRAKTEDETEKSGIYLKMASKGSLTEEQKKKATEMAKELLDDQMEILLTCTKLSAHFDDFRKVEELHKKLVKQKEKLERLRAVPEGLVEASVQIQREGGSVSDELVVSRMLETYFKRHEETC